MGVIQSLRDKGGKILIFIIGFALFMFLVSDALTGRNSIFNFGANDNTIGTIDGKNIDLKEFENRVNAELDKASRLNPNLTLDENTKDQFRERVWQEMIMERVLNPQFNKSGVDVTGQEIYDMCTSEEFANDRVRRAFSDPKTNVFNVNEARNFFKRLDEDQTGDVRNQWLPFEEELTNSRIAEKYIALAKAGVYMTSLEARNSLVESNRKYNFQFVHQDYANFSDTTLKATSDDVKAWYEKNKEKYKRNEEVRKINYVYFDFIASSEDTAEVKMWGDSTARAFRETTNDSIFVMRNLGVWDNVAKGPGEMQDKRLEDSLYNAPVGKVVGPYDDNGTIKIAKLTGIKMDTVAYYRASHILVKVAGPTLKDTLDAVAKATDYMNQIRSGKKTFEEMARLYGTDGTASTGGDLGWFGPGRMVKEFEDGVKRTPVGQMSIVKTQFGVHVVKNTATPSHKKIYVQILSKKIVASQKTTENSYFKVQELGSMCHDNASFEQACREKNISIRTADISSAKRDISPFTNAKVLVSWAFRAKKDEVSQPYTIEEKYVLAVLKDILKEGYMKPEEIADINALALKDKKAEVLIGKFNENMKNAQTPEQLAISFGSAAQNISNASFANPYLEYIGNEPEILAAVVTTPKGKFSKPVKGTNGVYVIFVNDVIEAPAPEAEAVKAQKESRAMNAKSQTENMVTEALKEKYKVKDMRYKF